jgi:hypothetical protein
MIDFKKLIKIILPTLQVKRVYIEILKKQRNPQRNKKQFFKDRQYTTGIA